MFSTASCYIDGVLRATGWELDNAYLQVTYDPSGALATSNYVESGSYVSSWFSCDEEGWLTERREGSFTPGRYPAMTPPCVAWVLAGYRFAYW